MEAMHRLLAEHTKMFAVIKADAYGHGAVALARVLEPLEYVQGFCVATVEEGAELRRAGVNKPILLLGLTFPEQAPTIVAEGLQPAVCSLEAARALSAAAQKLKRDVAVHIAVDTGMSRIGYEVCPDAAQEIAQIAALPHMIMEGIFTHFSKADETDKTFTKVQMDAFSRMIALCEAEHVSFRLHHCSNSAGIIDIPDANMDVVRAGISIYGLWPSDEVMKENITLTPALELKSHVSYVKTLSAGRYISYGGTYTTDRDTKVATVPVGYGDGYPRSLSGKGYVLINGQKAPILGRVCMDQFMVDVTHISDVTTGTCVTLAGRSRDAVLTIETLGDLSGRFNYEFVCCLGRRIPRIYDGGGVVSETQT
ncbi:MAG: alanine racemase [Lachnospiraceae bacterium]|nr:alanine racemase [Lachnospiraceae bacterium]